MKSRIGNLLNKESQGLKSKDSFIFLNLPIVHNLPENKPPKRKVFTFAGIQSSKGVTYDRATDKVYNNIYPDKPFTSGLVIPKSLAHEEDRPTSAFKAAVSNMKSIRRLLASQGLKSLSFQTPNVRLRQKRSSSVLVYVVLT